MTGEEETAAAEAAEGEAPKAEAPKVTKHSLIEIVSTFPQAPDNKIVAGDITSLLVGVRNEALDDARLEVVVGSINTVDHTPVYNLTAKGFNVTLEEGQEASVTYDFAVYPFFAGRDMNVVFSAYYMVGKEHYMDTFFNETVAFQEKGGLFDLQTIGVYLTLLGLVAGAAYLVYRKLVQLKILPKPAPAKKPGKKVEMGTASKKGAEWSSDIIAPKKAN